MCFFLRGGSDHCYGGVWGVVWYVVDIIRPSAGIYGKSVIVKVRPVLLFIARDDGCLAVCCRR